MNFDCQEIGARGLHVFALVSSAWPPSSAIVEGRFRCVNGVSQIAAVAFLQNSLGSIFPSAPIGHVARPVFAG